MSLDLQRLKNDTALAVTALQALPALRAQVADLQAKLAAAPHDDPSVQADVDQLATALEAVLPTQDVPTGTGTAAVTVTGNTIEKGTADAPAAQAPTADASATPTADPAPGATS